MITADEAQRITAGSLSEETAKRLLDVVDERIRRVAANGQSYLKIEDGGITDAGRQYLRIKLRELAFEVSETGLTIYW